MVGHVIIVFDKCINIRVFDYQDGTIHNEGLEFGEILSPGSLSPSLSLSLPPGLSSLLLIL